MRVEARFRSEVGADRVLVDVGLMGGVVVGVDDAMVCEASFPDIQFAFQAEGEGSFDELHCFFEGDLGRGCQEEMDVIGHDDEGVEFQVVLLALLLEDFD